MLAANDLDSFASRLRRARVLAFGDDGVAELAEALGIPPRSWSNYERGVIMPAPILLAFLVATGAAPRWLLRGEGPTLDATPATPSAPEG